MQSVEVAFHPSTYDKYFAPLDLSHPGFNLQLLEDFKRYQASMRDELPDYFGCDSEYGWPSSIAGCLEHIHLCIPPRTFNRNYKQIDRKCRIGDSDNDIALVYSRGLYDPYCFIIIGIFVPDAHGKCKDERLMIELGGLGRNFRYEN